MSIEDDLLHLYPKLVKTEIIVNECAFVGCSNLTINCEIASAPSGWSSSWKDSSTTVYWSM